jgi:hypothetical protein
MARSNGAGCRSYELLLTATPRFASFGKESDARDHLFVQDAHLAPRFFVACPDLFADRSKFCAHVALKLREVAAKLRDVAAKLGKIATKLRDVATQCGKISGDGGYLFGQLA